MQDHHRRVGPLSEARPCAHATQAYREWRQLGAAIEVALIRAGEAANEQSQDARPKDDDAR